jgi:hypothetical protein
MVRTRCRDHENRNENLHGGQNRLSVPRNASSERHGFGRLTKSQLTGFMVGTMKGFMVNEGRVCWRNSDSGSQSEGPRRNASSRGSRLEP